MKVSFGDHFVDSQSVFPSKKRAKEDVCQIALDFLDKVPLPEKAKKRTASEQSSSGIPEENWPGVLNEFCHKRKASRPLYREYEIDTRDLQRRGLYTANKAFSSTVEIGLAPLQLFGSDETAHPTKAEARRNAAKEAVSWLRANGHLSNDPGPEQKRQAAGVNGAPGDRSEHTGLTPAMKETGIDESLPQRVARLALGLGFSPPTFESRPSTALPGSVASMGFMEMSALFLERDVEREPKLKGHIGETGPVFGKKSAKEMCCREVMRVLEHIAASRGGV